MFILYNKRLKKPLIHPRIGLWCSPDKKEADDLLKDCHDYVKAVGLEHLLPDFVVSEITEVS